MENNWTLVYSTDKAYEAEIAKAVLAENGIEAIEINRKDSSYIFGEIDLYVDAPHSDEALLILISNELK